MFQSARLFAATLCAATVASVPVLGVPTDDRQPRLLRSAELADIGLSAFQNAILPGTIDNDRLIRFGGIGSDIFRARGDSANEFWMVTDRGPNGQPGGRRTFPVPEFNPTIVHVKVKGDRIELLEAIPILNPDRLPVTGLPNVATFDETPWNYDATVMLATNPNGLDTEGLIRTASGDFWVVDEYSPSLVHVDGDGIVLERIVPIGSQLTGTAYPVMRSLPEIFTRRRQNRGFEALALTPDNATLFIALQSPLEHPTRSIGRASRNTRILRVDVATAQVTGEFVFRLDEVCTFVGETPGCALAPGEMKLSGMAALSDTRLLIDERTDDVAKVVLVDVSQATDIYLSQWDQISHSPALESLADPAAEGIAVLPKQLIVDLSTLPGMPKKIEGIALVNPEILAVANDNDFGLVDETMFDAEGNLTNDTGVRSRIIYVKLTRPLLP
jgi:hypothetical protein